MLKLLSVKSLSRVIYVFLCVLMLQSCIPQVIFSAATATAIVSSKDRSLGTTIDDITMATKIRKEFIVKGFRALSRISVDVVQGRVLLTGVLDNEQDIINAVDICWSIRGVQEVINELKMDHELVRFDPQQYTKDTWITSRIKTSLFFDRDIKFINYTIVTLKNVVYIFGLARSYEELEAVTAAASKVVGVERVVSHVRMMEE